MIERQKIIERYVWKARQTEILGRQKIIRRQACSIQIKTKKQTKRLTEIRRDR